MVALSRRSFLTGAATAAGAAAVGAAGATSVSRAGTRTSARGNRIRLTSSTERVVIIGSGFGGGVTALRLAQAGVPVLVLERGQWWPTGPNAQTFPHASTPDKRDLFYTVTPEVAGMPTDLVPYAGLLEPIVGDNLTAIVAAGVGGGSLVYQGMTLQPSQAVFESLYPSGIDYAEMNSTYYPRVASMLQIATAPEELINSQTYFPSRQFAANVQAAGYGLSKIPMPIDWNYALDELKGEMAASYTNGDCALGVNNGGKHSVDVTYLQQAIATGNCTVQPLSNVTDIAQASDGTWQVHVNVTNTSGIIQSQQVISTGTLVLAAGTVNSTRLLLRAAHNGTITGLPDGIGQGYGTNGDQIYVWTDLAQDLGTPQGGPVVYGSFDWNDPSTANTVIQASLPPVGVNLTGIGLPSALLPAAAQLAGLTLDTRSTMLVGYGVSDTRGSIGYNTLTGQASLSWPSGGDSGIASVIKERITAVAGTASNLINTNDLANSTWHSLGGACMGTVCDTEGRVQGKKGLYVLDGALQPGNTGACNPSMTIAAVAERALDRIVKNDVGSII